MRPWHVAPLALLAWRAISVAVAGPPPATPPNSLYQLDGPLVAQDGRAIRLDAYRGHPVLITMFYAGCQATCPVIIDTLRAVEKQLDVSRRSDLRVLLISIDPAHDTPAALAAVARERRIDTSRWTLARTGESDVRRIAAALGQQYRRLPDGQYSHATQISVLNAQGEIAAQSAVLGQPDEKLLAALRRQ
jgi:protein SCO1/2